MIHWPLVSSTTALLTSLLADATPQDAYKAALNDILNWVLPALIFVANLTGGLIVGVAIVRGLIQYIGNLLRPTGGAVPKDAIRIFAGPVVGPGPRVPTRRRHSGHRAEPDPQ